MISLFHSLSPSLSLSLSPFALSGVSFNKRIKQDSTATLLEAVNHSKPEATNTLVTVLREDASVRDG